MILCLMHWGGRGVHFSKEGEGQWRPRGQRHEDES